MSEYRFRVSFPEDVVYAVTAKDAAGARVQANQRWFNDGWYRTKPECPLTLINPEDELTPERIQAAHEFLFVEDGNDQLAVCEVAMKLHKGLPVEGDFDWVEELISSYMNKGDEYMADELIAIFENTIWCEKV